VESLIRLAGDYQLALLRPFYVSPPILALAFVGPVAMVLDLRRAGRQPSGFTGDSLIGGQFRK
ncbi:MAG TPA: hypothetical protein VEZ49_05965, partial [Gemmatimonadales bacterium]|nr:hypothetical protein [Gemmatimonadales bacterium]